MTYIIRIIILFLILFNFKVPMVQYSASVSIIISSLYYLIVKNSFSFKYFFSRYTITILIGLMFVILITVSITAFHKEFDYVLTKSMILQFFLLCSIIYAFPILIDLEKEDIFEQAIKLIVWTFAIQGFIILLCFLVPPMGDFMIAMKPEEFQAKITGPYEVYFRGYALSGSPFFELPAAFGVSFMLFIRLLLIKGQRYFTGVVAYIVFFLLLLGIFCTGRTAFTGVALGALLGLISLRHHPSVIIRTARAALIFGVVVLLLLPLLMPNLRRVLYNDVFPFAFEALYNYQETGEFSTASSDEMINHYFALPEKIVIQGAGRFENRDGTYFMHTDAGYMRSIIYGGIFFSLFLLIYQFLYFYKPLSLSRDPDVEENNLNFWLFLLLFIHLFILEIKGLTIGTQQIMQVLLIFIGTSYIEGYYRKEAELEESDEDSSDIGD